MRTTRMQRLGVVSAALVVALLGACGEDSGGDDEAGGTEEVSRHLDSLEAAYEDGGSSEVDSHFQAIDGIWDDAMSDAADSAQAEELRSTLESQVDADAPPQEVSATVDELKQALG